MQKGDAYVFDSFNSAPRSISVRVSDGRTISVSLTPMKPTFSRFTAQFLDDLSPRAIRIRATTGARVFCILVGVTGLALLVAKFIGGLPWPAAVGGVLLLAIALIGGNTWSQELTLRVDRDCRAAMICQASWIGEGHEWTYALSEIAGVQVLRIDIEGGVGDVSVTTYEVNLVLATPAGKRVRLYGHRNLSMARTAAQRIATRLDVAVLDHSNV